MLKINKKLNTNKRKLTLMFLMMVIGFQTVFLFFQPASAQPRQPRESDIRRMGGERFFKRLKAKNPGALKISRANIIARNSSPGNMLIEVGEQPLGFGKTFIWDRKDNEILLAIFINAADDLGVSVLGMQECDQIEVTSAAGIASFSEDKGNPTASSLIGLVGIGLKVGSGIGGFPEAIPVINEAEKFAQEQFKATNAKTKRRNAFGVDPGSGHKAKQEGGIIISLPIAGEPYYSGNSDHKERWIKPDGTRVDANRPAHVQWGYFPIPGSSTQNRRFVRGSNAPLYITPWDWNFDDNAGFYKVFLHIKKGTSSCGDGMLY